MNKRLVAIEDRFRELEQAVTLPEVISDSEKYARLMKEYSDLTPIVTVYRDYLAALAAMEEAELLASDPDPEMRTLAEEEIKTAETKSEQLAQRLRVFLLPKDPNDGKNVIVEIRQGTGGEEAALFAYDLFRMYSMFAADEGLTLKVIHENPTELGGYKEITFSVGGDRAYSFFRFESGVHRVQRIPVTESNGKIQTSAVSVAVLPEVGEVEIKINPADIRFESCKSSGAGGQHINKTESAVRLTHVPSGIVIECDHERSQFQNKDLALKLLRAKLFQIKQKEQDDAVASSRKNQIGSGDRSEKIRTYNYPQSRVTDHRINKTLYSLDAFLNGNMRPILEELIADETAKRLGGEDSAL